MTQALAAGEQRDRVGDERVGLPGLGPAGTDERGDALEGGDEEQAEALGVAGRECAGLRDRRARRPDRRAPGLAHAFAAAPGQDADILIVITPGVERFEYFRHLERIAEGKVPPESLLEVQQRYDTYFLSSKTWNSVSQHAVVDP